MKSNKKRFLPSAQKGFTLIELLVVIAIIGLLAGIVLVSLGGARDSARDARVTAVISETRSLAELVANSNNGVYNFAVADANADLCAADATLNEAHVIYDTELDAVEDEVIAQVGAGTATTCQADTDEFCVYAPLNASGQYYCIDSTASSGQTGTNPSGLNYCDGTTFVCP